MHILASITAALAIHQPVSASNIFALRLRPTAHNYSPRRAPDGSGPETPAIREAAMDAAPATLADSLLDDLDDLSDGEPEQQEQEQQGADPGGSSSSAASAPAPPGAAGPAHRRRRLLERDDALRGHLVAIRAEAGTDGGGGDADDDDDGRGYRLIVASNGHLARLRDELSLAHADLCEAYHPRFPELEDLLPDPAQYRAAVLAIGNEMDLSNVHEALSEVLTSNQILTVSVASSTTAGGPLTEGGLVAVRDAAGYVEAVAEAQAELTSYVGSRMEGLAPSVCAVVGAAAAARLVALAGGLAELSRIPACNLQVLGQVRQSASSRGGMSTAHGRPHTGLLAESDLVARCPPYLRRKALKVVASKLALAARCDYVNVEAGRKRTAEVGRKFRSEIEAKFHKWGEPDRAQTVKALPKPDLTTKKRRGGRRIRRMKERFEETELMKQANKRAFSKETGEYGDDAMGLTLGMLDTKEGGNLRIAAEKRKMRKANTKASRKRAIQMSSGATNGLASSMVFTPVQGLELVNPDAQRDRVRAANNKWFNDNAGFQSASTRPDPK